MTHNNYRVLKSFQSTAGPLWICEHSSDQPTEGEESQAQLILFWRNDLLRKPKPDRTYAACVINKGSKVHGWFLVLFLPNKTPFIGAYRVGSHLQVFDLESNATTEKAFEPELALRAESCLARQELFSPREFEEIYGDVQLWMEDLIVP